MKDEYGEMTSDGKTFVEKDFILENSVVLPQAELRYQTYGQLNEAKDNVVVVCHALTGNASLHSWWGDLLGANKAFDSSKYLIVCCNILGSCYGSTNPQSINPETNTPYGKDFPDVSVKDTVKLQLKLIKEEIGASSIKCVIGGSFGGMQTMEFAVQGGITGGEFVSEDGKHDTFFLCIQWFGNAAAAAAIVFVLFDTLWSLKIRRRCLLLFLTTMLYCCSKYVLTYNNITSSPLP
jgi:homoserine O-acetyltransferase